MNIEEERKAFVEAMREENSKVNDAIEANRIGKLRILERGFFEIWCLAKAHAEEMAKPAAVVYSTILEDCLVYALKDKKDNHINGYFTFKDAAVRWAKENGYRVVGE